MKNKTLSTTQDLELSWRLTSPGKVQSAAGPVMSVTLASMVAAHA
jgi:hypothetical protein